MIGGLWTRYWVCWGKAGETERPACMLEGSWWHSLFWNSRDPTHLSLHSVNVSFLHSYTSTSFYWRDSTHNADCLLKADLQPLLLEVNFYCDLLGRWAPWQIPTPRRWVAACPWVRGWDGCSEFIKAQRGTRSCWNVPSIPKTLRLCLRWAGMLDTVRRSELCQYRHTHARASCPRSHHKPLLHVVPYKVFSNVMSEEWRPGLLMESPETSLRTTGGSELRGTLPCFLPMRLIFISVILVSYIS